MKTIRVAHGRFLAGSLATAALGLVILGSAVGTGCSSPEKAGGEGAQCSVFTDCAGGLFCVPLGSQLICSADAAALDKTEESGAAAPAEAAATPPGDGAQGTSGGGTPDAASGASGSSGDGASGTPGMPEASSTPPADDAAAPEEAAPPSTDDAGDEP